MYKIYFYKDKRGKQPVYDYLLELKSKNDKASRIKLNKHNDYLQALAEFGLKLGEPYIKHLLSGESIVNQSEEHRWK